MTVYLLFAGAAILLVALVALVWRIWDEQVRLSPEDEERERDLAELNDAQANRVSDQYLARPLDTDDAWQTMVQRGGKASRPARRKR